MSQARRLKGQNKNRLPERLLICIPEMTGFDKPVSEITKKDGRATFLPDTRQGYQRRQAHLQSSNQDHEDPLSPDELRYG